MAERTCKIDRCTKAHKSRGMCSAHYERWRTGASATGPIREYEWSAGVAPVHPSLPRQGEHHNWSGDGPTYPGAHKRINKELGRASERRCIDCAGPARDWSYVGRCADELVTDAGLRYCYHPEHYTPRCRLCHKAHDLASGLV